ncbi:archease [candidate division KSB1 bacterium]|nr:archease [candidate division KSB1 bacterium]
MNIPNLKILDHTGDIGFELQARNMAELFSDAALGMAKLICPDFNGTGVFRSVLVNADDQEMLMVSWLSEINFFFQTEQYLPSKVKIIFMEKTSITAVLDGNMVQPGKTPVETDIKAVTYHMLYVRETDQGASARILFDI